METDEANLINPSEEKTPSRPASTTSRRSALQSRPASNLSQRRPVSSRPSTGATKSRPPTGGTQSRPTSGAVTRMTTGTSRRMESATSNTPKKKIQDDDVVIEAIDPEKGCWYSFSRCIGGMWGTRQMNFVRDRELYARTTIRELVVYSLFLINLNILTFGMTSNVSFYYTQAMKKLFLNEDYDRIYQMRNFWFYLDEHFLDTLYWEYEFDTGDDPKYICIGGEDRKGPCSRAVKERNILYENRLIGLPRIRMIRVQNTSCNIHPNFQNSIKACYASYTKSIEDTSSFGTGNNIYTQDSAWMYASQSDLNGATYGGSITTYSGAGAVQTLHSLKNESRAILDELKELLWIDPSTRFISIDFTVYNPNINLFCIVKLAFEMLSTGGVVTSERFLTVKLIQYVNSYDFFILGCGIIHCAFIIYYSIEEFLEILKNGMPYFFGIWNIMDIVVLTISAVAVGYSVNSIATIDSKLTPLLNNPDTFSDFSALGSAYVAGKNINAILVFFAWIKLFKYISFNKTMTQLSTTLTKCAKDVGGFSVMFFVVFFAFAQLGYILFGAQVLDYSNFSNAIFALMRLILGDFDFDSLKAADRVLGPGFFLAYVGFVFFILLNMFLAIINDTYTEVKEEIQYEKNDFEVSDYVSRGYNNVRGKFTTRDGQLDIRNAIKMASEDGIVTYEEIRQNLKKWGFSHMEIEMFFSRYDTDGDFQLDTVEANKILNDISFGRFDTQNHSSVADEQSAMSVSLEEYNVANRRVERLEHSMGSIMTKIDAVIAKLDFLERLKTKRQKSVNKILGAISNDSDNVDDATKRKQMEELLRGELNNWDSSRPGTTESIKKH